MKTLAQELKERGLNIVALAAYTGESESKLRRIGKKDQPASLTYLLALRINQYCIDNNKPELLPWDYSTEFEELREIGIK